MGVTSEAISNNADGKVYQFGKMRVNTSAFADGDILYVSTTVAGGFQTTQPIAPNNIIVAAAVVHAANNGTLMIRPTLGSNINSDEGVLITTPANNNVLTYESSTSLWKNKTVETALGYTPLAGVHSIIPMVSGDVTYNGLAASTSASNQTGLSVRVAPYIPAQSITTSNLFINVTNATAGSLCTIVIYSDLNGLPNTRLFESADLDCSTLGLKTATTSFSFVAGTLYWLGLKTNGTAATRASLNVSSSLPLGANASSTFISYQKSAITYASPSPNPLGAVALNATVGAIVYITKA
jgi:hypothetical protein